MKSRTAHLSSGPLLAFIIIIIIAVILVSGCKGADLPKGKAIQPKELVEIVAKARIASVKNEDISTLKDSSGIPVAVRAVSQVTASGNRGETVSGACRLRYALELVGQGSGFAGVIGNDKTFGAEALIIAPAEGRLDLSKWEVCCALSVEENFEAVDAKTVCAT